MSEGCDENEWVLGDVSNDLGEHMFPKHIYDWSMPKHLCLSPKSQGGDEFIMYARNYSPGSLVTVNKRDSCLLSNSRVLPP